MATGVDAKLLKSTKFPPIFNQKVDMQKVNLQVMKKWIASRISDILGNDDDVVIELCYNLIESARNIEAEKAAEEARQATLGEAVPVVVVVVVEGAVGAEADPSEAVMVLVPLLGGEVAALNARARQ
ncbi:MAG: hypothetical protein STHCBS139747_002386 [Sporothrix thermara]